MTAVKRFREGPHATHGTLARFGVREHLAEQQKPVKAALEREFAVSSTFEWLCESWSGGQAALALELRASARLRAARTVAELTGGTPRWRAR